MRIVICLFLGILLTFTCYATSTPMMEEVRNKVDIEKHKSLSNEKESIEAAIVRLEELKEEGVQEIRTLRCPLGEPIDSKLEELKKQVTSLDARIKKIKKQIDDRAAGIKYRITYVSIKKNELGWRDRLLLKEEMPDLYLKIKGTEVCDCQMNNRFFVLTPKQIRLGKEKLMEFSMGEGITIDVFDANPVKSDYKFSINITPDDIIKGKGQRYKKGASSDKFVWEVKWELVKE